jgi:hypothetical protein
LILFPDPGQPDVAFGLIAEDGGVARDEFHTWIRSGDTIIDLTARHYPRYANDMINVGGGPRVRWNRPAPPPYLWVPKDDLPRYVRINHSYEASYAVFQRMQAEKPSLDVLCMLAEHCYRQIAGITEDVPLS